MIRRINNKFARIRSNGISTGATSPTTALTLNSIANSSISNGFGTADFAKKAPDTIIFRAAFSKTGTSNTLTIKLYWNTTISTSGATQLAVFSIPTTTLYVQFTRRIFFTNSNTALMLNVNSSQSSDIGDYAQAISTITISNWTTQDGYFFFVCEAVAGATDTISNIYFSAEI